MRKMMVLFLGFVCMTGFQTGCSTTAGSDWKAEVQDENPEEGELMTEPSVRRALLADGETDRDILPVVEMPEAENMSEEDRPEILSSEKTEQTVKELQSEENAQKEISGLQEQQNQDVKVSNGKIQQIYSSADRTPENTVEYTDSRKEEITEIKYEESVVDENDPETYEVVETEQEVPILYVNQAGDPKYAYENGVWYEYKYSEETIRLGEKNQELALWFLGLEDGDEEYDIISIDCSEVADDGNGLSYLYSVKYRCTEVMEREPGDMANLSEMDMGTVAKTIKITTEEKVPILQEKIVGTGEYCYYGWQELEGDIYYFDVNGEKVTGSQVIQGIRHEFDENGVKTSSSGIEVSEENGEIDWEKAADAGIDYAIIQCAFRDSVEGILVPDTQAEKNLEGARRAGLMTGISVFTQAITCEEAVEEATLTARMAEKYGITDMIAVTVSYANPEHDGRADGIGKEERTEYIAAYCQTLRECGYTPIIHADEAFLSDCIDMEKLGSCRLWLTQYDSKLTYTMPCEIWQYTAKGMVDGISGYTGLNIGYGK